MSNEELDMSLAELKELADEWREKLKNQALQTLIEQKLVYISPLVTKLLEMNFDKAAINVTSKPQNKLPIRA